MGSSVSLTSDYRVLLKDAFTTRRTKNPRYSLRAFARLLEMPPASLSRVLNKKRGLSVDAALKIVEKLELDESTRRNFLDSVEALHARSDIARSAARARLRDDELDSKGAFRRLNIDALEVLDSWYHFAILDLVDLPGFQGGIPEICQALGLPAAAVEESVLRLTRVGLLTWTDGAYKVVSNKTWGPDEVPSKTIQSYNRKLLNKAQEALETQAVEDRDFTSLILSVDQSQVPEMKAFIRKMHQQFSKQFGRAPGRNSVVAFTVQCFQLTKKR